MNDHQHIVVYPGNGKFYCLECGQWLTAREAWLALDQPTVNALQEVIEDLKHAPVQATFPCIDWSQYTTAYASREK